MKERDHQTSSQCPASASHVGSSTKGIRQLHVSEIAVFSALYCLYNWHAHSACLCSTNLELFT